MTHLVTTRWHLARGGVGGDENVVHVGEVQQVWQRSALLWTTRASVVDIRRDCTSKARSQHLHLVWERVTPKDLSINMPNNAAPHSYTTVDKPRTDMHKGGDLAEIGEAEQAHAEHIRGLGARGGILFEQRFEATKVVQQQLGRRGGVGLAVGVMSK